MTLTLLVALGVGKAGAARGFFLPFNLTKEMFAFTREEARSEARPVAGLAALRPQVLRLFRPDRGPGAVRSVRIALDAGGGWLYVDDEGRAELGPRKGSFDVVGWERLLKRSPALRALPRTDLVGLRVVNRTSVATVVADAFGSPILAVPARGEAATTSWFRPHLFLQGGRLIGRTGVGLTLLEPPGGTRPRLRVERTKTYVMPDHGGVIPVRIFVEDR